MLCRNQKCLLNKECKCQSDQVKNGAFCQSKDIETKPVEPKKFCWGSVTR